MNRPGTTESARPPAVEILLATYNGARFVEAQLDSLVAQTVTGWSLLVRDDGSTDDTVERIQRHAQAHGYPLRFASNSGQRLGYPDTFFSLVERSRGELLFFSDQDDVWLPGKVGLFIDALHELPADRPGLVHSDLTVVDEHLTVTDPSFLESLSAHPPRSETLLGLFCGLYVTGCATAMNAAARTAFRRPNVRLGHDTWMAMTCAALGNVRFLDQATVLYRQHGGNAVGAGPRKAERIDNWWTLSAEDKASRNALPLANARAVLAAYGDVLPPESLADATLFATLDASGFLDVMYLLQRGALPAHPDVARRVASVLLKMQVKHRLLTLEEKARTLVSR